jgi:hypothetical protein
MKPKLFAPPHMVRLYLEDEEKLKAMPGNPSANIRELVRRGLNASPTIP